VKLLNLRGMEITKWLELFNILELKIINGWSFSITGTWKFIMVGASQPPGRVKYYWLVLLNCLDTESIRGRNLLNNPERKMISNGCSFSTT
jgi:hypothetical protein